MTANPNIPKQADYAILIEKHKVLAFNIALKITKNQQDAEEIVQDAFVKAFGAYSGFKKESQFSTWFYRIVFNTAISSIRQKRIKTVEIDSTLTETLASNQIANTLTKLDNYDRKRLISKSLENLNELDYTILSLYYYQELSLKEISKIVDKKPNYLKVLLQRARGKLYNSLSASIKKELNELI